MTLRADAISFAWPGGSSLLSDVSFAVGEGELVALVGANGSGKSTLLRILAGLLAPHAGRVELGGHALAELGPRERARIPGLPAAAGATSLPDDGTRDGRAGAASLG